MTEEFFFDASEGIVWCHRCAPAEIMLLAGVGLDSTVRRTQCTRYGRLTRLYANGERMPARCHACETVEQMPRRRFHARAIVVFK